LQKVKLTLALKFADEVQKHFFFLAFETFFSVSNQQKKKEF